MAERFPGDVPTANVFGRRSLHEWEAYLFFEANIPASPDMHAGPTGWRLNNGGIPFPPVPDVDARPAIFAAEVERVRASLTEEQCALPRYAADKPKTELGLAVMKTEPGLPVMKTEPGLTGGVKEKLDDAATLKWAREDWARTELERQCRAYELFTARR